MSGAANQESPTFDPLTGIWTLRQTTPNVGGEYEGIYQLPNASVCSRLEIITPLDPLPPIQPNAPARILPCGADPVIGWVNQPSIQTLNGQCFNSFSIRSAEPFTTQVRVKPCYRFDFLGVNGLADLQLRQLGSPLPTYDALTGYIHGAKMFAASTGVVARLYLERSTPFTLIGIEIAFRCLKTRGGSCVLDLRDPQGNLLQRLNLSTVIPLNLVYQGSHVMAVAPTIAIPRTAIILDLVVANLNYYDSAFLEWQMLRLTAS